MCFRLPTYVGYNEVRRMKNPLNPFRIAGKGLVNEMLNQPSRQDADAPEASEHCQNQLSIEMARIYDRANRSEPMGMVPLLTRMLLVLSVLLALRFVIPSIVEEFQYAVTRGEQRAKFEMATRALASNPLNHLSQASQMVSQRVAPSVVHIEASNEGERPLRRKSDSQEEHNQGSGVIVSDDGYIVTNLHVIDRTDRIVVTLSDGRQLPAVPVGVDGKTDLAVLKVEATELIAAEWDDSDDLDEGALVWAVGSPFGFQHSITSGIVSGKNRSGRAGTAYQDFLQTDAAVNPGNSGGPLVNSAGRIVGINTMIVGPAFQGISLAVPSNVAQRVYKDLRFRGQVARGWLGIEFAVVTPELAAKNKLAGVKGALVDSLVTSAPSPAAEAGVKPDDVIVEWDGVEIDSTQHLTRTIAQTPAGKEVIVVVMRNAEVIPLSVKVGYTSGQVESLGLAVGSRGKCGLRKRGPRNVTETNVAKTQRPFSLDRPSRPSWRQKRVALRRLSAGHCPQIRHLVLLRRDISYN